MHGRFFAPVNYSAYKIANITMIAHCYKIEEPNLGRV